MTDSTVADEALPSTRLAARWIQAPPPQARGTSVGWITNGINSSVTASEKRNPVAP